jgi:hypothetical protein
MKKYIIFIYFFCFFFIKVTSLLLEAELRKLATLQSELESSSQSLIIESDNEKREETEEQQFELILAIS